MGEIFSTIVLRVKRVLGLGAGAETSEALNLIRLTERRSRTLEIQLNDTLTLLRITEERSRTQQYQATQALFAANYQMDLLQRWYVESVSATSGLENNQAIAAARAIHLETEHPIALMSNDHLAPDSTSEGIVRPTQFVSHCLSVLGQDIRCLDLGTGAAGL